MFVCMYRIYVCMYSVYTIMSGGLVCMYVCMYVCK